MTQPLKGHPQKPMGTAEDELVAIKNTLFRSAFQNSPAIHSIVRLPDGVIIEINDAFAKTLGYRREDVIGKTPFELQFWVHPEKLPLFRELLETHGMVRNYELDVRARDGSIRTFLLSSEVVDIGGVPHSMSAGVDITDRKEAEARLRESELQLRESEARFSSAFHATPILTTIARLEDSRFVEVNEAFCRLVGLERNQIIGRDSKELGLWVSLHERAAFFERVKQERTLRNFECEAYGAGGAIHTMLVSAEIIELNRQPHLITFALDITRRKEAEVEQQRSLQRERELNQLKSDFVSLVSHEFRTPLEIIMSSADNLDRYHDRLTPEKRQTLLRTIHRSVRRMSGMMEEVLVLGRLETDRMTFKPGSIHLPGFCQRVCDEIESATAKRCPILLETSGVQEPALGDENVLRHILTNLLSNAVKYSAPGKPVKLQVEREGQQAVCRVIDAGCGIPVPDQKHLFEAFYRGSNVRQIPGTGLGLLIVQRCLELHRGRLEFHSVEGEGTTFTVRLPLFGESTISDEPGS